jgi:hypothetical protein
MRDPNTVAAIIEALRQAYGDDIARVMLNDGVSARPNRCAHLIQRQAVN